VVLLVESVELLSQTSNLLMEFDGLFTDDDEGVLERFEFANEFLELGVQFTGLALVLLNDLDEVLDHVLIKVSLASELFSSIADHVTLGKGHLVDLNEHLELLEIVQEGLVLVLDLSAKFLDFAKVHISGLAAEVTRELSTDVGDSLTGVSAEVAILLEALDLFGEQLVKSGVRLSESGEACLFGLLALRFDQEVSDDVGLSDELRRSMFDLTILVIDLIKKVLVKILSHGLDLNNIVLGVLELNLKETDLIFSSLVLDLE